MAINKVQYGDNTLIDLTEDSVTPSSLLEGAEAHNAAGEKIVGIVPPMVVDDELSETSTNPVQNKVIAEQLKSAGSRELTEAEYNALTEEEQMNGTSYYVTDGTPDVTTATMVLFDNSETELESTDVQEAIVELANSSSASTEVTQAEYDELPESKESDNVAYFVKDGRPTKTSALNILYSNTESGLEAHNVQGAIDETNEKVDGIIESVTNSNGTYIKYADGTLICMKKVASGLITSWSAWGSVYESPDISLGNWSHNFLSNPIVSVTLTSSGSGGWLEYVKGVSTTSAGSIRIVRPNSVQSLLDANIIAIGRWK